MLENSVRAVAHPLKLTEPSEASPAQAGDGVTEALVKTLHPLHNVKATLRICVGDIELSVGELLNAKRDDVLTIDRLIDEPVDILLEGNVIARGELVAVNDSYGVRLTEVPTGLSL